jgi:hypothetical protein
MIQSDAGLRQSIEQLQRMYEILAELRSEMSARNPDHFKLFAEGPIEQIRRLRAEIDEYLGIDEEPVAAGHERG